MFNAFMFGLYVSRLWTKIMPNRHLQKRFYCLQCTQPKQNSSSRSTLCIRVLQFLRFLAIFPLLWLVTKHPQNFRIGLVLYDLEGSEATPITSNIINKDNTTLRKLRLRLPWDNLQPISELATLMVTHQNNCSIPMGTFLYRNKYGFGSDLHIWGQALCNGMQHGLRLRTVGNWTWMDQSECSHEYSPMRCYFQSSELNCPGDIEEAMQNSDFDKFRNLSMSNGHVHYLCERSYHRSNRSQVRMSAMEFLFLHLTPRVIQEAERQLNLVFRGLDEVPKDLITIHVRWGDKGREMKLVQINEYIDAVRSIIAEQASKGNSEGGIANIYLATEDPEAVRQFKEEMPSHWNVYVEHAYSELLPHRIAEYNGSPKMAKELNGRPGLVTLGSLLVAMEATHYILTTASNWSRVMNELRQAILDPRCGHCTTMKDLREVKNEW